MSANILFGIFKQSWYRWIPISGRFVCTTKNENKRMHPYMYITGIVWCIMHVNTMGIGNFYTLQTPIISLPKSLEGPLKWNNASMSLHIVLLYMLTHPGMTLFWKHFTLIDQFFFTSKYKSWAKFQSLENFSQLQN